jgi:hypothetical protein
MKRNTYGQTSLGLGFLDNGRTGAAAAAATTTTTSAFLKGHQPKPIIWIKV